MQGKEYVLTEKVAPKGYEIAESITFKAEDGLTITMKDKLTPNTPSTGDRTNIMLYVGGVLVSTGVILALWYYKKKKNEEDFD